jgi:hypothetical protein
MDQNCHVILTSPGLLPAGIITGNYPFYISAAIIKLKW